MAPLGFGLIGRKLGHSFSSAYFTRKFNTEGLPFTYDNFEIDTISELPEFLNTHTSLVGFNITIPYKISILRYLSSMTSTATLAGAVNTVYVSKQGLIGHNTDVEGFGYALDNIKIDKTLQQALILGTGGASKAVEAALGLRGVQCCFISRTSSFNHIAYKDLTTELISSADIIVNATPIGMWPDTRTSPDIVYDAITPDTVCFDLVYNPKETEFMKHCLAQGAIVCNGLDMLHCQAEAAWEWWNEMLLTNPHKRE